MENNHKNRPAVRILVVPLDWGLGHATRCVPIINELCEAGAEVYVAGEGMIVKILEKTRCNPVILPLKGYRVRYSRNRSFFFPRLLLQLPRVYFTYLAERRWLRNTIKQYRINAVISDNRWGLYHKKTPCVFITHQLAIATGISFLDKLAQKIQYRFINRFSECWVPDIAKGGGLAGKLSHPVDFPRVPIHYLGPLSRFIKKKIEKNIDLLILLSGPEPQRTIFEELLLEQHGEFPDRTVMVRGYSGNCSPLLHSHPNLQIWDYLDAERLNELILRSRQIVARSGYSTVMDLVTLEQRAILVPTPGQTEQEYLAKYLHEQQWFYTRGQEKFSVAEALAGASRFAFVDTLPVAGVDKKKIHTWVQSLTSAKHPLQ